MESSESLDLVPTEDLVEALTRRYPQVVVLIYKQYLGPEETPQKNPMQFCKFVYGDDVLHLGMLQAAILDIQGEWTKGLDLTDEDL